MLRTRLSADLVNVRPGAFTKWNLLPLSSVTCRRSIVHALEAYCMILYRYIDYNVDIMYIYMNMSCKCSLYTYINMLVSDIL